MESTLNTSAKEHHNSNDNNNSNNSTDDLSVGDAMVSFYTTTYHKHMPEQVYAIPLNILPEGLNSLVNSVLSLTFHKEPSLELEQQKPDEDEEEEEDHITFDFLYKDEYITSSLLRFLQRRKINYEDVLHIEYTPSLEIKEGVLLPHDDWVSCVRAPFTQNASVLLTANYDRCIRLWRNEQCIAIGAFHTGAVKEVCLRDFCPSASSSSHASSLEVDKNATAINNTRHSKEQTQRKRSRYNNDSNNNSNLEIVDFECVSASKDGALAAWHYNSQQHMFQLLGYVNAHVDGIDGVDCTSGPFASQLLSSSSSSSTTSSSNNNNNNNNKKNSESEWCTLVASASWDGTVKVYSWDQLLSSDSLPSTRAPLLHFTDHTRPVLSCRFNYHNSNNSNSNNNNNLHSSSYSSTLSSLQLYSAGLDGNVKSLNMHTTTLQSEWTCNHPINKLAVTSNSPSNDWILCACTDNRARLIDSRSKSVVKVFSGHRQWLYSCAWLDNNDSSTNNNNNNNMLIATCSEDATIKVYDLRCTATPLLNIDHLHTDGVLDVAYCGNAMIASGGKDNKLKTCSVIKQDSM